MYVVCVVYYIFKKSITYGTAAWIRSKGNKYKQNRGVERIKKKNTNRTLSSASREYFVDYTLQSPSNNF